LVERDLLPKSLEFEGTDSGKFALALVRKDTDGIRCLTALVERDLLPKPLKFDGTGSGLFAQTLVEQGDNGIECLMTLEEQGLLPILGFEGADSGKFALELAANDSLGIEYLGTFSKDNLLSKSLEFEGTDSGKFAQTLAGKGEDGIKCLTALDQNNLLPKPLKFDGTGSGLFAQTLVEQGDNGIKCLTALVENGSLPILGFEGADSGKFALALVRKDLDGIKRLMALAEKGLLPKSLEFEGTDSGKFALELAGKGADGIKCLTALLENGSLTFPNLKPGDDIVQSLIANVSSDILRDSDASLLRDSDASLLRISVRNASVHCLAALVRANPSLKSFKIMETEPAANFAQRLLMENTVGISHLTTLVKEGLLPKLTFTGSQPQQSAKTTKIAKTTNITEATKFALALAGRGDNGIRCLTALLDKGLLPKLTFTGNQPQQSAKLALYLVKKGAAGIEYLTILVEKGSLIFPNLEPSDDIVQSLIINVFSDRRSRSTNFSFDAIARCLTALVERDLLPKLTFESNGKKTGQFVKNILENCGNIGVRCIRALDNKGLLPFLQAKPAKSMEKFRTKLNEPKPDVTELTDLIDS
jgi:hypothetical protein